jgi:PAS domain S-box-containing protein
MFEFWHFESVSTDLLKIIEGDFSYPLVFLSLLVSSFAAYALLVVLERVWQVNIPNALTLWKVFGSVVFGLGIWAMHFIGMLAFRIPISITFDVGITLLSVFTYMVGAYCSVRLLAQQDFSFVKIQLSALFLALSIGSMHFISMEAMAFEAKMIYDPISFIISIVLVHFLATISIYLIKSFHRKTRYVLVSKIISSVIIGTLVACMHYFAMAAVSFYMPIDNMFDNNIINANAVGLSMAIAGIVFIIVVTTILCALIEVKLLKAKQIIEQYAIRENDIVEHMADGLLTFNSTGIVENINSSGFLMFGYERDTIIGCKLQSLMKSDRLQHSSAVSLDEVLQGCLGKTFVAQGVKEDGSEFPIEVNFSRIPLQKENTTIFNCVARDVTQRSEMEDQLRQSQKLESLGQLSAGIAHEINTPTQYVSDNINFLSVAFESCLNIIRMTHTLINKDISEITQLELDNIRTIFEDNDMDFVLQEIPLAIEQSSEGLKRVKKIIAAMKSFSHTNQGEMGLVDITESIESTKTVSRSEWRYIAEFVTSYSEKLPEVNCLRDEFNQVILNFIVNAAHAIEEKYGKKSEIMGSINIDVYQQGNYIKIVIKDDGIGMSRELKSRIFDPFFTTKAVGKGTGQGLSMAYSVIVEKHKGSIEVESELQIGTTFTISLPIT